MLHTLQALQQQLPASAQLQALAAAIRDQHGAAVQAVIYYGSCLRSGELEHGIADFYVIVDNYQQAQMGRIAALLNQLLPPNVFYIEHVYESAEADRATLRAKYAVVSVSQFLYGVSGGWLLPYLWARFAQPSGLLWVRDAQIAGQLQQAMIAGLRHFLSEVLPLLPTQFSVRELWQEGLLRSYATELRAERLSRIRALYDCWSDYYDQQTAAALAERGDVSRLQDGRYVRAMHADQTGSANSRWRQRRWLGKFMSVLRLTKSLFTFRGAVDYAAWKVERHSGQPVQLSALARRWPLLGGWVVLWRLLRSGSLR